MSRSSRPISLQSAMVIRRAQAQQLQRRQAQAAVQPTPARSVFSLMSLFGPKSSSVEGEQVDAEPMKRAA